MLSYLIYSYILHTFYLTDLLTLKFFSMKYVFLKCFSANFYCDLYCNIHHLHKSGIHRHYSWVLCPFYFNKPDLWEKNRHQTISNHFKILWWFLNWKFFNTFSFTNNWNISFQINDLCYNVIKTEFNLRITECCSCSWKVKIWMFTHELTDERATVKKKSLIKPSKQVRRKLALNFYN